MNRLITEIINQRFSCRIYEDKPIEARARRALAEFLAANCSGPFGTRARFALVAATDEDRSSLKGLGTYGYIKGATGFIVGATEKAPKNLEDYGYMMEHAILIATDLGLGTCWLGGTFTKSRFAKKIAATSAELVPAVTSVGYIAADSKAQDRIRQRAEADNRLPHHQLFFDQRFGAPFGSERTGVMGEIFEAVRWAPSASNRQPWRIVRQGRAFHFYLRRSEHYGKGSLLFTLLRLADLQRVDMGIAMCHFELVARQLGQSGRWIVAEPDITKPGKHTEYAASWIAAQDF